MYALMCIYKRVYRYIQVEEAYHVCASHTALLPRQTRLQQAPEAQYLEQSTWYPRSYPG